jgi:hypothetical protein
MACLNTVKLKEKTCRNRLLRSGWRPVKEVGGGAGAGAVFGLSGVCILGHFRKTGPSPVSSPPRREEVTVASGFAVRWRYEPA